MNSVSAVILTKNEEDMLPGCLASLGWANEIVVVDSLSTDRTREIAEKAGAKFLEHRFENFSSQFNWGIEQASGPWVFMIDADEVVDEKLANQIQTLLAEKPEFEIYNVIRDAFFMGRRMRASSWSGEPLPRLFRKGSLSYEGLVHPIINMGGRKVGRLEGRLLHYTYRSIEQYFDKQRLYSMLWAKDAHSRGKRVGLPYIFANSGWRFFHNYLFRGEILDGGTGLLTASLSTVYTFVKYVRLWGLNRMDDEKDGKSGSGG